MSGRMTTNSHCFGVCLPVMKVSGKYGLRATSDQCNLQLHRCSFGTDQSHQCPLDPNNHCRRERHQEEKYSNFQTKMYIMNRKLMGESCYSNHIHLHIHFNVHSIYPSIQYNQLQLANNIMLNNVNRSVKEMSFFPFIIYQGGKKNFLKMLTNCFALLISKQIYFFWYILLIFMQMSYNLNKSEKALFLQQVPFVMRQGTWGTTFRQLLKMIHSYHEYELTNVGQSGTERRKVKHNHIASKTITHSHAGQ